MTEGPGQEVMDSPRPGPTLPSSWEAPYTGPSMVRLESIWTLRKEAGKADPKDRDHSGDPD